MSAAASSAGARTHLRLPEIMGLNAAAPLAAALLEHRGKPLALEADGVERLGALCFQVLVSARITWAADHAPLSIVAPSAAFTDALTLLGGEAFVLEEGPPT